MAAGEIQRIPTPRTPADLGLEEQRMQEAHRKVQEVYEGTREQIEDNSFTATVGDAFEYTWITLIASIVIVFFIGVLSAPKPDMGIGAGVKAVGTLIKTLFGLITGTVTFIYRSYMAALLLVITAVIGFGIYMLFF